MQRGDEPDERDGNELKLVAGGRIELSARGFLERPTPIQTNLTFLTLFNLKQNKDSPKGKSPLD
ncbi:MAG: hypothetical protein Tsb0026_09730 [Sulfuricaulis sp.]